MMSIRSSNAFYPLAGILSSCSPLEYCVRYHSDLPPPFGIVLRNMVVNSPAFANGNIFIMRIKDRHNIKTFQVVPSRDCQSRNPNDKAGEVWYLTRRNHAANLRYCMYEGALIKNQSNRSVTSDYSAVPCEPQKAPLQTLATRLSGDNCLLLCTGPAGTMVQFGNEKPQALSLTSSALPQYKWPSPKYSVRTPSDPCPVEVASLTTESVNAVKIVMGLLGPFQ